MTACMYNYLVNHTRAVHKLCWQNLKVFDINSHPPPTLTSLLHVTTGYFVVRLTFGYPPSPLLVNIVCVWPILLFTLIVSPHYHVVRLTFTPRTQNTYDTNYSHHLGYYRKNMISPHGLIIMIIFQGDWPLLGCPRVNIRISSNSNPLHFPSSSRYSGCLLRKRNGNRELIWFDIR